jgi:hypothetical protein
MAPPPDSLAQSVLHSTSTKETPQDHISSSTSSNASFDPFLNSILDRLGPFVNFIPRQGTQTCSVQPTPAFDPFLNSIPTGVGQRSGFTCTSSHSLSIKRRRTAKYTRAQLLSGLRWVYWRRNSNFERPPLKRSLPGLPPRVFVLPLANMRTRYRRRLRDRCVVVVAGLLPLEISMRFMRTGDDTRHPLRVNHDPHLYLMRTSLRR